MRLPSIWPSRIRKAAAASEAMPPPTRCADFWSTPSGLRGRAERFVVAIAVVHQCLLFIAVWRVRTSTGAAAAATTADAVGAGGLRGCGTRAGAFFRMLRLNSSHMSLLMTSPRDVSGITAILLTSFEPTSLHTLRGHRTRGALQKRCTAVVSGGGTLVGV